MPRNENRSDTDAVVEAAKAAFDLSGYKHRALCDETNTVAYLEKSGLRPERRGISPLV
jgi:hypothetical protein